VGQRKSRASSRLYLGCFFFDEPGETEWTGTFELVVEATSPEDAVERFYEKLEQVRKARDLFDKPSTIYIEGLIELPRTIKSGLLVNWRSVMCSSPPQGELTCLIPGRDDEHEAVAYGYSPSGKKTEDDDGVIEPFLDFGGENLRKQLEKSSETRAAALRPPEATGASRTDAERQRAEAKAKKEAAARARAEAQAKRERSGIVRSTLEEMGARKRSGRNPKDD